jgi:hypothetical protein
VIVDECHHISTFTFERIMRQVKAKYRVPMLARMYERRLKGYSAIGYVIDQDAPALASSSVPGPGFRA